MSESISFRKVKGGRVSDEIAAQIREKIADGHLPIGTRLPSERALAEQFGASRNTLREAMRSLENAGLIRLQKGVNGGAIIQNRSGDVIASGLIDMYHMGGIRPEHLTQARILYEAIIIRLACEHATEADFTELEQNIEAAEQARKRNDFDTRIELHLEFHRILARIAGNPIMVAVMNGVLDIMTKFVRSIGPYDNSIVTPSRRRFLKHLRLRDAEAAVVEMQTLLTKLEKRYLSQINLVP